MKLYYFSSELSTFVKTKWFTLTFTMFGIFIGVIIFFGLVVLNQSLGFTFASHSANRLAVENDVLRKQVLRIAPQVNYLELQVSQLSENSDKLQLLINRSKVAVDTISGVRYIKFQPLFTAVKKFSP